MKNRNRKGRFLMIAGLLLVAAALFLTARNLLEEKSAQQASEDVGMCFTQRFPDTVNRAAARL